MNTHIFMLLLSVLSTVGVSAQKSELYESIDTRQCQAWVDSVFATMSPTDRISQLIMYNVAPNRGDASRNNIKTIVEGKHVGGLFFSKASSSDFADMTNYAQALSDVPLLMGIDGEWGVAMRVTDAPRYPYNMTLGAIQDATLLYRYGQQVAQECRDLGIHVNFAPVLDVNSNPNNPVIGNRSFGEDPARVAKLGTAYSLGLESGGVMAVGKHFPGHGDTNTDSHKGLTVVNHTASTFNSVDLVPFKAFINAGCGGIMVGHLSVPSLDASKKPASMSYKITTVLLQDDLGFDRLIYTDGLGMKGAVTNEDVCVSALKAGADVLLEPPSIANSIAAIKKAIDKGELSQQEIDRRCKKLLAYKYALGLKQKHDVIKSGLKSRLNSHQTTDLIQQLYDASMTAVRNTDNILPIGNLPKTSIAVVNIGASDNEFTDMCRKYADVDVYVSKDGTLGAQTINKIKGHDIVIAAVYDNGTAAQSSLAQLKDAKGLIPVFMMNPYKTSNFAASVKGTKAMIMAYEDTEQARKSAAKALFGGIEVSGRMPVNVDGIAKLGDGVDISKTRLGYSTPSAKGMNANLTARMDSAVNAAMESGAFPGAQLIVVKDGDIIVDRCYGHTTADGVKVTPYTLYDLASVSKTVGTLPGVMKAYDLGYFGLDDQASTYIPGLNVEGKSDITPRMLLYHETGMPASLNMFKVMMDSDTYNGPIVTGKRDKDHTIAITGGGYGHKTAKMRRDITSATKSDKYDIEAAKGLYVGSCTYDSIMACIYRVDVKPTRKYVYSCLNFCLLMDLEQHVTGIPHQQWVTDSVWGPIGAYTFCYRPTERYPLSSIAATELDTYLRKQHVHGYVHDELAAFSGGVQGNAGVFGTATDVAKLCQTWLNDGSYGDVQIFTPEVSRLFTQSKSETCRRGLGFDKPDVDNKDNSPTCDEASASTYGHTGFTGTCFWVDPESDLIFVFLCNRVDPTRSNKAFSQSAIRPTLMSMVYQAME